MQTEGTMAHPIKVERIYRVLLSIKSRNQSWYRIAKEAEVSYGWAYRVLQSLEARGIIDGAEIINARELFLTWASRKDWRFFREYHVQDPVTPLRHCKMKYALTGYFAENLVGHYLFPRYFEIYIHEKDAAVWNETIVKSGYVGRGNLKVIVADDHVFYESERINDWPLVSVQQLIVDLYRNGAECSEAADLLVRRHYG